MPNKKLTALTADTSPTYDDLIYLVDGSDSTYHKVTLSNISKALGWVDVRAYGAKGDGITNDFAAISGIAVTDGMTIFIPPGYNFYINADNDFLFTLSGKENITICGMGYGSKLTFGKDTGFAYVDGASNKITFRNLHLIGTVPTIGYIDNEEQGAIALYGVDNIDIHNCYWDKCGIPIMINQSNSNVNIHHNSFYQTHAGVQSGAGTNSKIWITDNYFEGHVTDMADKGSDDQIAFFDASGDIVIERNIIDKKGSTAFNQAHGIYVCQNNTANQITNITIADNIVKNVRTTVSATAGAAISVISGHATTPADKIIIKGNHIYNSNIPIEIGVGSYNVNCEGNIIDGATALAGFTGSGSGIYAVSTPAAKFINISNNIIKNGVRGIDVTYPQFINIIGNQTYNMSEYGIRAELCERINIHGNILNTAVYDGIQLLTCTGVSLVGNQSGNNGRDGLRYGDCTGVAYANLWYTNTGADVTKTAGADLKGVVTEP